MCDTIASSVFCVWRLLHFGFVDSPRRFTLVHWIAWLNALVGVVMVMVAHGHYTIDVLIAYYVTTRLFWTYHTMANNNFLLKVSAIGWLTNGINKHKHIEQAQHTIIMQYRICIFVAIIRGERARMNI